MTEHLARPEALPALLLVPFAAALLWLLDRGRARALATLVGARVHALAAGHDPKRRRTRRIVFGGALFFACCAALQPVWGEDTGDEGQRGVDLVVCLDVSRSMLAKDVRPSRLGRAQREIRALADRARGDRVALVLFAGEARLAVPLTQDLGTLASVAELADPYVLRRGGTDLGAALAAADEALRGTTGAHEAVVLLTDGEDLAQKGLRAARRLADRGIAVHTVGLGSSRGAKIAVPADVKGGGETFLRDRAGGEIVTAMDAAGLHAIADATGGTFAETGRDEESRDGAPTALVDLYDRRIAPMTRKSFAETVRGGTNERGNRFQWALVPAFALLLLDLLLAEGRRR